MSEVGVSGVLPSSSSATGVFLVGVKSTWRSWFGGRRTVVPFSSPDSPESRSSSGVPIRFGCSSTGNPSPDSIDMGGCCVCCWFVTGPTESRNGESSLSSLDGESGGAIVVDAAVFCRNDGGRVNVLWNWGGSLRMFFMSSITSRSTRPLYRSREPREKNPPPVVTDGTSLDEGMVKK